MSKPLASGGKEIPEGAQVHNLDSTHTLPVLVKQRHLLQLIRVKYHSQYVDFLGSGHKESKCPSGNYTLVFNETLSVFRGMSMYILWRSELLTLPSYKDGKHKIPYCD